MFQYDISEFRDYDSRKDLSASYYTFIVSIHQDTDKFPFEYVNPVLWKGKTGMFRIVGFGGYMSEGGWRVYATYRDSRRNHVIQHTWRWDYETDEPVDYRKNEFVG